jgi:hypothetical protein
VVPLIIIFIIILLYNLGDGQSPKEHFTDPTYAAEK